MKSYFCVLSDFCFLLISSNILFLFPAYYLFVPAQLVFSLCFSLFCLFFYILLPSYFRMIFFSFLFGFFALSKFLFCSLSHFAFVLAFCLYTIQFFLDSLFHGLPICVLKANMASVARMQYRIRKFLLPASSSQTRRYRLLFCPANVSISVQRYLGQQSSIFSLESLGAVGGYTQGFLPSILSYSLTLQGFRYRLGEKG